MKKSPISLIHPTGNPNSREAALALAEANLLSEIITTIAYTPSPHFSFLPKALTRELERRTWLAPQGVTLQTHPLRELIRIALMRSKIHHYLGIPNQRLTDWIYLSIDHHTAQFHLEGLKAVYAYEDGAATSFEFAKQQGILCLYDLPIMFYRMSQAIQTEEAERFPELAPALQAAKEPQWKLERKEKEVQLADHIFVASSITRNSLVNFGIEANKISVIPYGAPLEYFRPQPKPDDCFRAIYVGRLEPRKGIHYLLSAWKSLKLPNAELWLVGINEYPSGWLDQYAGTFRHIPSVPHAALNEYYSAADILVFPSLVEGFGLVLLEAMACGIPAIASTNTAGPDLIDDGVDGFIIPIRDTEALQAKLEWCYQHRSEVAEMGKAARHKAEQLTWRLYRQKLADRVQSLYEFSADNI